MRLSRPLAVALALAAGVSPVPARAAGGTGDSEGSLREVWFLQDGRLQPVPRRAPTVPAVVRALLAGPTAAEHGRGLRSAVPGATPLRSLAIERRIVTVDLGARFAAGTSEASLRLRVGQLVRTVGAVPGVRGVRVLVEGGVPLGLFPGLDLRRPVTPAAVREEAGPSVRELQRLLVDLGYLGAGGVTGALDERTAVGVLAFQKWAGLARDGRLTPAVESALLRATRPQPATSRPGRRIEVLLDRQLALLVDEGRVVRAVHVSTGAGGATPQGAFRVYRKEAYSWSVPFEVWLPWASYFAGGIAFHEYPVVPAYPASHGCIRVTRHDIRELWAFAAFGTPVDVLGSSV